MSLLRDIAEAGLLLFGAVMLALQFAALAIGNWVGRRRALQIGAGQNDQIEGVGLVVGGLLGLLAFTLSISIGIADKRYDDRRRAALDEANAIGTAWLRAEAIGHPRGGEIARLLEGYTEVRIAWLQAPRGSQVLRDSTAETARLQTLIWGHAAAIARERPDAVAASLMASLNETFDLATTQRWAFRSQMPPELPWLLLALTMVSVGGIGFQWGLKGRWHPVVVTLLLAAWSACLVLVVDLASPRIGATRADTAAHEWTLQGFRGGVPIPPPP